MSGIAGIAQADKKIDVKHMLTKIAHRGHSNSIVETGNATLGVVWPRNQSVTSDNLMQFHIARDKPGDGHFAQAGGDVLLLKRDKLGVAPLYYGWTKSGSLCFASEVKSLLVVTRQVHEMPPGYTFDGHHFNETDHLQKMPVLDGRPEEIAKDLYRNLERAVLKRVGNGNIGAWLSGGLDSSTLAALGRRHFQPFHTFTVGLRGATDVENAQVVAEFIQSEHHTRLVTMDELLAVLPDVIYHLESFDAWLVRSSMMNYLVAKMASDYVPAVFSGEGGDELFAGYDYLRSLERTDLPDELIDITTRLHNTALQRVDRSASAHATVAHVVFLDPDIVDFALSIPSKYKLKNGIAKWILRLAMTGSLPQSIINRPKAKFWQGAGVEGLFAQCAEQQISDKDFSKHRLLSNGWNIRSKEELLYYNIFLEHFGEFPDLQWMGRTKGTPES